MKINDKPKDVLSYNNTLYLSDNFLKKYDSQKYNNLIRFELFRLIYQNLSSYFPFNQWQAVNQSTDDSTYLSNYGKQYLYYDMMDFYFAFLDSTYSKTNEVINKKIALIRQFYQQVSKEIKEIKSYDFKWHKKEIEKKYDINIIELSDKNFQDFTLPLTLVVNEPINKLQLKRTLNILPEFLETIKQENFSSSLKNIYLVGNMEFLQGTDEVGGTYEVTQKSILLANIGNNDKYILGVLYHEFSSLLLRPNFKKFPKKEWIAINGKNFNYKNLPVNEKNIYEINEISNKEGFIDKYGTTCFENDYNEYTKLYFMDNNKLKNLANTYPKINQKLILLQTFLKSISKK